MNWKENKLGLISLVFALLPILFMVLGLIGVNYFFLGATLAAVLTGLVFASPLLAIGFAISSSRKKEKNQIFGKIGLKVGASLLVLMVFSIIIIPPIITPSPHSLTGTTADALEDAYNNKSKLVTTQKVTFTQSNNTLARLAIVEAAGVGIEKAQICLSLGDYAGLEGQGDFDGGIDGANPNSNRIMYEGEGTRDVKVSVVCYEGNRLEKIVDDVYEEFSFIEVDKCECVYDDELAEQTCCLVFLRVPR